MLSNIIFETSRNNHLRISPLLRSNIITHRNSALAEIIVFADCISSP